MISTVTLLLLVTPNVYVVLFVLLHPFGVAIASLAVNVNVNVPLVHVASLMLHVGPVVSIFFHVTVTLFVVSPSVTFILHVSSHVLFALGVYVMLFPFILHVHFVHLLFASTVAVIVSQLHALALLNVFQLTVFALFHTSSLPIKLFAVNTTSVHVIVAFFSV